ncbi:MAG TPA: VCBS repeat-containing protein [Polyangiaceae bacterium]|nr:VCBS repeat-containing protein [Polyangiaceae bacterium]
MRAAHFIPAPERRFVPGRAALVLVALAAGLGPAACGSTTSGAKAGVAGACNLNSDCASPYVCTAGRCHVQCNANEDCARDELCVQTGGQNVCRFSSEGKCTFTSDCDPGLFCATDGECRNQCQADRDCLTGLVCTTSHACASPSDVGQDGDLVNAHGGTDGGATTGTGGRSGGGEGGAAHGFDAGVPLGSGGFTGAGGFDGKAGSGPGPGGQFGAGGNFDPGCGSTGQPCCGLTCNDAASVCYQNFCRACGGVGDLCCTNDVCNAGNTCNQNSCVACGNLGDPCCGSACNGSLACTGGTCDVACTAPLVPKRGECKLPIPRLLSPLSGSISNTRKPVVRFALPAGIASAHVQLCADHDCTTVLEEGDSSGATFQVGSALPMGPVFFRVASAGADAGTPDYGPSWEMTIGGAHDAALFAPWGAVPDFDADGFADVVAVVNTGTGAATRVYRGTAGGPTATPITISTDFGAPGASLPVSDFDGDGYVDFASIGGAGPQIFRGSATGLPLAPSQQVNGFGGHFAFAAGDVDADGYGDLVFVQGKDDGNGNLFLELTTLHGSSGGIVSTPTVLGASILHVGGGVTTCDVNGDARTDLVVTNVGPTTTGSITTFFGPTGGTNQDVPIANVVGHGLSASCVGDVDGDGYDDVAVLTSNSLTLYKGSGAGLASSGTSTPLNGISGGAADGSALELGLGDFNGDGYADYAYSTTPSQFAIVTGGPSGTLTSLNVPPPGGFTVQSSTVTAYSAIGDVNGDKLPDLAVGMEWVNPSAVKNHQAYFFGGGTPATTASMVTLPVTLQAVR